MPAPRGGVRRRPDGDRPVAPVRPRAGRRDRRPRPGHAPQLGAEADPATAGRGRHARTARARGPGRRRPDDPARSGSDRGRTDDRAQPGRAGPAAGRPGRRFDGGCRRLRASGAHRADRGRFEVGQARTAPQSWRPAPDPRGAGQRGRLRLVPGPGHRLAASRLGRRGRSRRRRLDRGSERLVGQAGDLHRRSRPRSCRRFGTTRRSAAPRGAPSSRRERRRASNAGSTARS